MSTNQYFAIWRQSIYRLSIYRLSTFIPHRVFGNGICIVGIRIIGILLVLLVHIVGIFNNFALFHSFVHGFAHIDSFVMTLFLLVPLSTRHSSPARSL